MKRVWRVAVLMYVVTWLVNRSLRRVSGPSMLPTLQAGDLLLTAPASLVPPRRGDIVTVAGRGVDGRDAVKRLVGLPGDRLPVPGLGEVVVPAGHVVVLGDNPDASTDSRHHGPVPRDTIRRVVVLSRAGWRR